MLSSDLVAKYARYVYVGKQKKLVSPVDVYIAASLAQNEILRDLRLLQDKTTLVFSSEQVQRQPRTISNITGITTVIITTSESHGYKTGEEVVIPSGMGYTGISGRRTITVTSTTTFTLNSTTGSGTFTTGATVYPLINGMVDLVSGRQLSPNDFPMTKVDYDQVNQDREDFSSDNSGETVFRIYQLETDPMTIGVQGVPITNVNIEVRFYRVPLPCEDVSDTINPIVPDKYRRLMELGTQCYIFEDMDDEEIIVPMGRSARAMSMADKQRAIFDREKQRVLGSVVKSRIRANAVPRGIKW